LKYLNSHSVSPHVAHLTIELSGLSAGHDRKPDRWWASDLIQLDSSQVFDQTHSNHFVPDRASADLPVTEFQV